jgi:hypothetical protein
LNALKLPEGMLSEITSATRREDIGSIFQLGTCAVGVIRVEACGCGGKARSSAVDGLSDRGERFCSVFRVFGSSGGSSCTKCM